MATIFQSFRSSALPRRLLQYAVRYGLSKLEVLDTEALDLENLDFALGMNSAFEFRDVAIKVDKLQKLIRLPPSYKLERAKVLVLRVTVPIEFYTKPIVVEVDGVDIRLKVQGNETKATRSKRAAATPDAAGVVPNPMDLAQSFLDTQPSSERKELEQALLAETQDMGASVAMSDDGSEDEASFGTGQPLSLPAFLADYLQGIIDRVQVKIRNIKFELNLEVPLEPQSTTPEPVTFQIALDSIDVEGVTTEAEPNQETPHIVPKEGKRHISLNDVRAYLMCEANVFSALARSPSMTSPSVVSSRAMTRNPPSRETSSLSGGHSGEQSTSPLGQSLHRYGSQNDEPAYTEDQLADSEEALSIPYEFGSPAGDSGDESPATPRASVYHELDAALDESIFHSTMQPSMARFNASLAQSEESDDLFPPPDLTTSQLEQSIYEESPSTIDRDPMTNSTPASDSSDERSTQDLTESHMYTHEAAESMYMSALSRSGSHSLRQSRTSNAAEPSIQAVTVDEDTESAKEPRTPRQSMPGGWDETPSTPSSPESQADVTKEPSPPASPNQTGPYSSGDSSPAFSKAAINDHNDARASEATGPQSGAEEAVTPKGPTRLVKELLSVKTISVYIPSQHQHIEVQAPSSESVAQLSQSLGQSVYPQAPGAFSVDGSLPQGGAPGVTQSESGKKIDDALEVDLSPVIVKFDASLGFLLAMVFGRLADAAKTTSNAPSARATNKSNSQAQPNVIIRVQELALSFLNQLGGVADTATRYLERTSFNFNEVVLLNATLQNLTFSMSASEQLCTEAGKDPTPQASIVTKVELEKFRFGYANDDILSFDNSRILSTSIRDAFLSNGCDIGIKMLKSGNNVRTEIETLPLVVHVDLQRLDETFSWFGGLSSFLNMSASMTSSPSPIAKSPAAPPQKPKGVRFETPIDPMDKSAAAQNKLNLRIGGAFVNLVGKDCKVAAESSAIKLVSRDEGVGMACSIVRLSGPYLRSSRAEPAIITEIAQVRLDFLLMPKDTDLEKLLELIIPSKVKFDEGNDEIMVDTLLRQRRKGSVLRASFESVNVRLRNMGQLSVLPALGEEIAKLSTVAKYLPEDDRPGLLTLGRVQKFKVDADIGARFGNILADVKDLDLAHTTFPSLAAAAVSSISISRNGNEDLVSSAQFAPSGISGSGPVLRARMIGDEMEPVVKLKLKDLTIDYRVPTIMDFLDLGEDATPQDFEASLAASVSNLGDQAHTALISQAPSPPPEKANQIKPMGLEIGFTDCLFGLNPLNMPSKMVIALTDSHLEAVLPKDAETKAAFDINKASILLIDDIAAILPAGSSQSSRRRPSSSASRQVAEMCARGFVDICFMSSAQAKIHITPGTDGDKQIAVDLRDDLLVLETCADSTQTLISLANALKPPTPPSKENKYRTNVMPVQDLLASISAEAFGRPEGEYDFDQDFAAAQSLAGSASDVGSEGDDPLRIESQFFGDQSMGEEMFDAMKSSGLSLGTSMQETSDGVLLTGSEHHLGDGDDSPDSDDLEIHDDFYQSDSPKMRTAKVWNSKKNSYDDAPKSFLKKSPLKISVRDVHFIWNLFDGYDWENTREIITKAVQEVEAKVYERQARFQVQEEEVDDEEAVGDFLFNSIYISIPANRDPQELSRAINEGLNDNMTETGSVATTTMTGTTNRTARPHQPRPKRLKLQRSKQHKITFELQGINVDLVAYPSDCGETVSSVDIRVNNLDIFDHVPTSTWKKFATYDRDMGEREMGTSMVHLEILNVKPLPELGASEIVLRATLLPLRLHVDQDALDFITRFFEFKDENVPVHSSPSDVPFVQRAEINNVPVKLDFKPKRVDYAGLRSGHTTEFMNFIVLEEARMVLRHVIIYGVSGFDRLGKTLNDIWMPDVRNNQLPGVVAGLAPVRSLVNIGSGFRDLVEVPLREYKKDGRVIRSISKGAAAFAKTTGTELVKLGAKLAVGTQYALQGAEGLLTEQRQAEGQWDDDDLDAEEKRQISLYAEQPTGVIQGIRGGYRSLTRDVNLARDAIIAVPGEVMESQTAGGAARAVLKRAPTIIFRPAVGVTKVIGQTLMGATNTIDPQNRRRIDEKYKKH